VDGLWCFTRNRRHRLDFSWFDISRDASKKLLRDIEIGDTVFPIGTEVKSSFDLKVFKEAYGYSIFQDDRIDLGASLGLFVMPIKFEISASGLFEGDESESITAPLLVSDPKPVQFRKHTPRSILFLPSFSLTLLYCFLRSAPRLRSGM